MSIFKKEKATLPSVKEYYGDIEIDLLDANDKILEYNDVSFSDFGYMLTRHNFGLLTKTQYSKSFVGIIKYGGVDQLEINLSNSLFIAPVLKFDKPLKEIFKNIQKDREGRDIVYFSKYPIEAIRGREKANVAVDGKETDKEIHYALGSRDDFSDYKLSSYFVVSYNNEEYIKATSQVTANRTLRSTEYINYHEEHYVKLKPIKWLCDYENNRLVCLDGLIAGIPYNRIMEEVPFKKTTVYDFLKSYLLPDLMQFVEVPKLEDIKEEDKNKPKDNILNMLRELLNKTKLIKDINDKILIVEDIKVLANLYGTELLKIKSKDVSIYGSTERELIRNGILPYYVYIEGEINRLVNEDNREKENKEIEEVINKLKERANLINDEEIKNKILLQIDKLNQDYLNELFKGKVPYQRIDFNKPLEEVKTSNGEVKLTFIPPRPVLIKELVEKEIEISRRIDREINNNDFRSELLDFKEFANDVVKR